MRKGSNDNFLLLIIYLIYWILKFIFYMVIFKSMHRWISNSKNQKESNENNKYQNYDYEKNGYKDYSNTEPDKSTLDLNNAYSILGLDNNCTMDELNKKYKQLAKQYHPDINKSKDSNEKMAEINSTYDMILKSRGNKR